MPEKKSLNSTSLEILLVEDNPGDVRLIQEALRENNFKGNLSVARDGEQALLFLRRQPPYENSPRPSFVLLDLNLPRKSGMEVLEEMKWEPGLQQIPVFVLSTSTRQADIAKAYDLHANCYLAKPPDLDALVKLGKEIEAFWLATAMLPV